MKDAGGSGTQLERVRERINQIDDELVALFIKRMEASAEIAVYKEAHGLPVLDCAREDAVLERVSRLADDAHKEEIRALFATLFELSRAAQQRRRTQTGVHLWETTSDPASEDC